MYRIGILNFTKVYSTGGGFHYMMSLLEGLKCEEEFDVFVFYDNIDFLEKIKESNGFNSIYIDEKENLFPKIIRGGLTYFEIRSHVLGRYEKIKDLKMDLLISFGSNVGFQIGIPTISFIGDVMYRYYPNLPEYSRFGNMIKNLSIKKLLQLSDHIVIDSNECAQDLVSFFNVDSEKLFPIPMCAPPHIYKFKNLSKKEINEVCDTYQLPEKFIFYPAQFWAHKNHRRLVKAIHLLKVKYHVLVNAVFVGAKWESYENVIDLISQLELSDQIKCLGYVSEKDLVALYKKSKALVFASFAEYTNLPVIEAMVLGTPVVCSNKFSMPQQLGGAGLLFDPFDIEDIAKKILNIWQNKELQTRMVKKGFERSNDLSAEKFNKAWKSIIIKTLKSN